MQAENPPANLRDVRAQMTGIVRRHAHDVRNYINCLDLEASLLEELVTDPEALDSVARIRAQLTQLEATIQALTVKFTDPQPITLSAADLLQLWKHQIRTLDECWHRVDWSGPSETVNLTIDQQAVLSVLRELVVRAAKRSPAGTLHAGVRIGDATVHIALQEPAQEGSAPEDWLPELELIVARNGGTLERSKPPGAATWTTTISFPETGA